MNNNLYTLDASAPSAFREASFDEILQGAGQALAHRFRKGTLLDSPRATRDFLTMTLGARELESFCCIFVDNRHRVIEFVELLRGTIDEGGAHPREVVKGEPHAGKRAYRTYGQVRRGEGTAERRGPAAEHRRSHLCPPAPERRCRTQSGRPAVHDSPSGSASAGRHPRAR